MIKNFLLNLLRDDIVKIVQSELNQSFTLLQKSITKPEDSHAVNKSEDFLAELKRGTKKRPKYL